MGMAKKLSMLHSFQFWSIKGRSKHTLVKAYQDRFKQEMDPSKIMHILHNLIVRVNMTIT